MHRYSPTPWKLVLVLVFAACLLPALQQESKPEQKPDEKTAAAPPLSTSARLTAAKAAFLRKTGTGDNAAYDVVSSTLEGWGRFELVNSLDKADIVVEVFSVSESESGGISASAGGGGRRGNRGGSSRQAVPAQIKIMVYDSKTRVPLWTGTEHPKPAMRKTDRENNEVEAAERLMQKFHDEVEPPVK